VQPPASASGSSVSSKAALAPEVAASIGRSDYDAIRDDGSPVAIAAHVDTQFLDIEL
jgi:hypothetical protein